MDRRSGTDAVIVLYLVVTAGLVVAFRESLPSWKLVAAAHLASAALVASLRFMRFRFVRDWYPVALFPVLYKEVELLAAAFGNWGLTEAVVELESSLFGAPSLTLSRELPWVALSEYLHFCYFSYVLWLPLVGGYLYFHGKLEAFRELVLLVSVTFSVSYLIYILFPVDSPFYLSDPPGAPFAGNFFYDLVHFVSERGGARGGAFPSSHVSVSTVILLTVLRYEPRLGLWLLPIYPGLVVATVYGRFHYAVDVFAGWALAGTVVLGYRLLERERLKGA